MQDLQGDPGTVRVHGRRDRPMLRDLGGVVEEGASGLQPALLGGREAAGDDQGDPAFGALRVETGDTASGMLEGFQPRVHGTHQHPVWQRQEAQIEGLQKVWEGCHGRRAGGAVCSSLAGPWHRRATSRAGDALGRLPHDVRRLFDLGEYPVSKGFDGGPLLVTLLTDEEIGSSG